MQFYARGVLERHGIWPKIANGQRCVATPAAQHAYASFGFVRAQPDELTLKPID